MRAARAHELAAERPGLERCELDTLALGPDRLDPVVAGEREQHPTHLRDRSTQVRTSGRHSVVLRATEDLQRDPGLKRAGLVEEQNYLLTWVGK